MINYLTFLTNTFLLKFHPYAQQYFPEALTTWGLYVISTLIVITLVKLLNLALHVMYDEAQIVSDTSLKKSTKNLRETPA